jgi:lipid II:glycine glycyltransferase (peptidoglycan interpeptide bridge formation enzyme)
MCEPLAGSPEIFDTLFREVQAYGRKAQWKSLELRGGGAFLAKRPAWANHFIHSLDLTADEVAVRAKFRPNIRQNIRKAKKESVQVKFEHSLEATAAFYKLNCSTRRHHGLPPQPWRFFEKMWEHVIASGKGWVALAEFQHHLIAGAVFVFYGDQVLYKFGASNREFLHLRPNDLLMWEAIQWCIRKGIRGFSFGRTEPDNKGLVRFKRKWGPDETLIRYIKFDLHKNVFLAASSTQNTSYAILKKLPEPVLKMLGKMLYRHVG